MQTGIVVISRVVAWWCNRCGVGLVIWNL